MDYYTETTTKSYLSKITDSIKGIFIGFVVLVASIVLLWLNESNSIEEAKILEGLEKECVSLPDTSYDPLNNNKVVWISGMVVPHNTLRDEDIGITSDELLLERKVNIYQWVEKKESRSENKLGGETETVTTYKYSKDWVSEPIASASFKIKEGHNNPSAMKYQDQLFIASSTLGDFNLSHSTLAKAGNRAPYSVADFQDTDSIKKYGDSLYLGSTPEEPTVGDLKISYRVLPKGEFSIVGQQYKKSITSAKGNKLFIYSGVVTPDAIFSRENYRNSLMTWFMRIGGLFLMYAGFRLILRPLVALSEVVPMLGSLIGFASSAISGVLAVVLWAVVVAISWFTVRPFVSLMMLAVIAVSVVAFLKYGRKKNEPVSQDADVNGLK